MSPMRVIYDANTQRVPIKAWLEDIEPGAMEQALHLARLPFAHRHVALMPDTPSVHVCRVVQPFYGKELTRDAQGEAREDRVLEVHYPEGRNTSVCGADLQGMWASEAVSMDFYLLRRKWEARVQNTLRGLPKRTLSREPEDAFLQSVA